MSWIFLVLIGVLFTSTSSLFLRILLKDEESDPFTYSIVFQLIISALFFTYLIFTGLRLPPLKPLIPYLILMSLFYGMANLLSFKGLKAIELSESSILRSSKAIWTTITAIIFLGEPICLNRVMGMLLIVIGIIIISWKGKKWKLKKGHFLVLASAMFYGIAFTNDAFLLNHFEVIPYLTIAFLFPPLLLLASKPKSISKFKLLLNKKKLFLMIISSLLLGMGCLAIYSSYQQGGDASQVGPIAQSSVVLVVLMAFIFLKERSRLSQKLIGALLSFAGVWLLII